MKIVLEENPENKKIIVNEDLKGFTEFEVFPTLWDEWNPCLIMIKAVS